LQYLNRNRIVNLPLWNLVVQGKLEFEFDVRQEKNRLAFGMANRMKENPYNKAIRTDDLGRHTVCLRKRCAGDAQEPSFQAGPFALVRRSIGRYTD
jgi:hypothetical protein